MLALAIYWQLFLRFNLGVCFFMLKKEDSASELMAIPWDLSSQQICSREMLLGYITIETSMINQWLTWLTSNCMVSCALNNKSDFVVTSGAKFSLPKGLGKSWCP